ncbi:hypothetical protein DSO57_1032281 [Entomophthora muscae]|uniref:Uncharacterized protein n=1 Tax=Entomophthora muscae TaxID=34485 RepID=A0ACC2SPT8_9FUNG|nr:hypothetical protein DSO57_1032281 [Entomophthora muscae]
MFITTILYYLSPLLFGFSSAFFTRKEVSSQWYRSLRRPWFSPPRYVFAPVWTILYLSVGYCLYLIHSLPENHPAVISGAVKHAIYTCWGQLVCNYIWSWLFFLKKDIKLALLDIFAMWILTFATLLQFFFISTFIGLVFVPYFAWISFATAITYSVCSLNQDFKNPAKQRLLPAIN